MAICELVIVLGSTVDDSGSLSTIAQERLNATLALLPQLASPKLLLTGGFGAHFNKTNRAYCLYALDYLLERGVRLEQVSALVPSLDTVEDATLSFRVVNHLNPACTYIVTSDFHMERVKYVFNRVYSGRNLQFVAAAHVADEASISLLMKTERFEMSTLRSTGKSSLGSSIESV